MWYSRKERGIQYPLAKTAAAAAAKGLVDARFWVMDDSVDLDETVADIGLDSYAYIARLSPVGDLFRYTIKLVVRRGVTMYSSKLEFDVPVNSGIVTVRNSQIVDGQSVRARGVLLVDTGDLPADLGYLSVAAGLFETCCLVSRGGGVESVTFTNIVLNEDGTAREEKLTTEYVSFGMVSGKGVRLAFAANTLFIEASPAYTGTENPRDAYPGAMTSFGGALAGPSGNVDIQVGASIRLDRAAGSLTVNHVVNDERAVSG